MALRTALVSTLTVLLALLPLLAPLSDQPARQHDLRQIARVIEQHEWSLLTDPARMAAFQRLAARDVRLAAEPMPRSSYLGLAAGLIASVGNPHTEIWPDPEERYFLPVTFYWASDGLVTVPVPGSPPQDALGDRVLTVGGKTPATIAHLLRRYTPGSSYQVRTTAWWFGYLSARYSLEWLGVVDRHGAVPLTLETAHGRILHLTVALAYLPDFSARQGYAQGSFIDRFIAPPGVPRSAAAFVWRVVPRHYGVFWLRSFNPSPALQPPSHAGRHPTSSSTSSRMGAATAT